MSDGDDFYTSIPGQSRKYPLGDDDDDDDDDISVSMYRPEYQKTPGISDGVDDSDVTCRVCRTNNTELEIDALVCKYVSAKRSVPKYIVGIYGSDACDFLFNYLKIRQEETLELVYEDVRRQVYNLTSTCNPAIAVSDDIRNPIILHHYLNLLFKQIKKKATFNNHNIFIHTSEKDFGYSYQQLQDFKKRGYKTVLCYDYETIVSKLSDLHRLIVGAMSYIDRIIIIDNTDVLVDITQTFSGHAANNDFACVRIADHYKKVYCEQNNKIQVRVVCSTVSEASTSNIKSIIRRLKDEVSSSTAYIDYSFENCSLYMD